MGWIEKRRRRYAPKSKRLTGRDRDTMPGWTVHWIDGTGARRSKAVKGDHSMAERYLREREAEAEQDRLFPDRERADGCRLFSDFVQTVLDEEGPGMKARVQFELRAGYWTAHFGSAARLRDIRTASILAWCATRLREGVSKATINHDVDVLRGILRRAVVRGLMPFNPCDGVARYRADNRRTASLNDDQAAALIAAARASRNRHLAPLVIVGLNTGARLGELLSLRWEDVELDGPTPTATFRGTKNGSARQVPLVPRCVRELTPFKRRAGRVFPMKSVRTAFNAARSRAGLASVVTFHVLRHTFVTRMAIAGKPLAVIQRIVGHASVATTERYLHAHAADVRSAMDGFDLGGPALRGVPDEETAK